MARKRLAKHGKRRILVVANEAVDGAALRDAIKPSDIDEPTAEVLVIVPALNSCLRHWLSDEDEARRSACARLTASLKRLRTAGVEAEGRVGDPDPVQAVSDVLWGFRAHEIVIATDRDGPPHWLARHLIGRARRRFAQPVVHVVVEPSEDARQGSAAPTRRRRVGSAKRAASAAVLKASGYSSLAAQD